LLQEGAIAVRLTTTTPEKFKPNSGACAFPSEAVHVTALFDRLAWSLGEPSLAPALLAHVLVHEITPIQEGIARHSVTGVMKANWTPCDYYYMQTRTLSLPKMLNRYIVVWPAGAQAREKSRSNSEINSKSRVFWQKPVRLPPVIPSSKSRGYDACGRTGPATAHRVGQRESAALEELMLWLRGVAPDGQAVQEQ
jgi:hypothetical protein